MKSLVEILALTLTALSVPAVAAAGTILIPGVSLLNQVDFHEPIGQSFTAEDPSVEAGLYFSAINPHLANTDPVRYDLYAGHGTGGTLLATLSFSLPDGFVGFKLVDLTSVALTVGNVYSLTASIVGSSGHWGINGNTSNVYPGGSGISGTLPDFALLVRPVAETPVPEPSTLLLVAGALAFAAWRRSAR